MTFGYVRQGLIAFSLLIFSTFSFNANAINYISLRSPDFSLSNYANEKYFLFKIRRCPLDVLIGISIYGTVNARALLSTCGHVNLFWLILNWFFVQKHTAPHTVCTSYPHRSSCVPIQWSSVHICTLCPPIQIGPLSCPHTNGPISILSP